VRGESIGITGFAAPGDVDTARACVARVPAERRLLAGVLVSAKTLRGVRAAAATLAPDDGVRP
jgi:hypothetical protein